MNIPIVEKSVMVTSVSFTKTMMTVYLEDGRELYVPLEWFQSLRGASQNQLKNWRFINRGEGIHWKDMDEDICIEYLFSRT